MNNSILDRIMQMGANRADGWTASLTPASSVSLQAMDTTSRSRNRLMSGRPFQGHTGTAVSRSSSCKVGFMRGKMIILRLQQKACRVVWRWSAEGAGFAQPGEEKTTERPDICL